MRADLRVPALLATLVASACRPHPTTVLTLDVAPREIAPGDTVRMTLTVANPRADTLRLAFEPGCAARFAVRHAAERWRAHPVPDPCTALATGDSTRVVVAPGGSWRADHAWVARGEDAAHPLVAGDYVVLASLAPRVEVRGGRRAYQLGEAAPDVPLRVRPAAP
jgi:hypothetical protein